MHVDDFAREAAPLHTRLTRVVWLVCGDRSVAEDCAQEALLRAWRRVAAGEDLRSLEAWTTTVALNESRSRGRRRAAEQRALDRVGAPAASTTGEASDRLGDDVAAAVLALPRRQREVVVLHYLLDLEVARIAEVAGISTGAVKNALFHARAALADALGDDPRAASPAPVREDRP